MGNTIESNAPSRESKPTPPVQDASSADTEANFDIEQFVHTSGEGFGNDRPMDADNGSVDVAALGSVAGAPTVAGKKMSRKEKKQAQKRGAAQEKILQKVTGSLYGMSGYLQGIAGQEIIALPGLQEEEDDEEMPF